MRCFQRIIHVAGYGRQRDRRKLPEWSAPSSYVCWHVVMSASSYKWMSLRLWRSCQLRLPSEQTGHGQEDLINKPLSIMGKSFILSRAASVESSSIMNLQSPPRGYGFCFLISTPALYWITIVYIRYSFLGLHLCVWLILKVLPKCRECPYFFEGWGEESAQNWPEAEKQLQKIQFDLRLVSFYGSCHILSPQRAQFDSVYSTM